METTSLLTPPFPAPAAEDAPTTGHKSARSPRVEVITRGERRRVWPPEQKREIVMESLGPALTPTEVARKYAITTGLLYTWRRQVLARPSRMTLQRFALRILRGNCRGGNSGGGDEGLDQENPAAVRGAEGSANAVPGAAAQLRRDAGHGCGGDDVRGERADGDGAVLERHCRAQAEAAARIAARARPGDASQP